MSPADRRRVFVEILLLWLGTTLLIKVVYLASQWTGWTALLILGPFLFIYAPVALCRWRNVDETEYRLTLPLRDLGVWRRALLLNGVAIAVIWVPWLLGWHFYQTLLFGNEFTGALPEDFHEIVLRNVFVAAFPEEFFYRGYIQRRLEEVLPPRSRVLGARVGVALVITSVLFAVGHSIVILRWWHFAIFFPGLIFGWMRSRTDDVVAGSLFHAWCNIAVTTLESMYGVGSGG